MSFDLKNPGMFDPMIDDFALLPDDSAVYLVVARNSECLETLLSGAVLPMFSKHPVLYVGGSKVQGLRARIRNHFLSTARRSTLRKSLGSLNNWREYRVYDNGGKYSFDVQHEHELSIWMKENIMVYYWLVDENIDEIERDLINDMSPPLNLKNNHTQVDMNFRQRLIDLRN